MKLDSRKMQEAMEALGVFGEIDRWGYPQWKPGCPCGCGADTAYDDKRAGFRFRPGHDAKLVSNAIQAIRGGADTQQVLSIISDWAELPNLANKIRRQLMHFPKNGPTRKAARKLVRECSNDGRGESFVRRLCRDEHQVTDAQTAQALGVPRSQEHTYHIHDSDEDCGVWAVLNGYDTKTRVLQRYW